MLDLKSIPCIVRLNILEAFKKIRPWIQNSKSQRSAESVFSFVDQWWGNSSSTFVSEVWTLSYFQQEYHKAHGACSYGAEQAFAAHLRCVPSLVVSWEQKGSIQVVPWSPWNLSLSPFCIWGQRLFSWAPESLRMVTAAMKLKDACCLEGKLWQT